MLVLGSDILFEFDAESQEGLVQALHLLSDTTTVIMLSYKTRDPSYVMNGATGCVITSLYRESIVIQKLSERFLAHNIESFGDSDVTIIKLQRKSSIPPLENE